MAGDDPNKTFDRKSLAVAWMMGAEEMIAMATDIVRQSAACGGINDLQAQKLTTAIHTIANRQTASEEEMEWE